MNTKGKKESKGYAELFKTFNLRMKPTNQKEWPQGGQKRILLYNIDLESKYSNNSTLV